MTTTQVIDLSHWNTVQSFASVKAAGVVGVIHKATEGNYNTDPEFRPRHADACEAGLLFGAYHFGTGNPVGEQVSRFCGEVGDHPDLLLALDLEDYSNPMTLSQAREFIEGVEARMGRSCVLYSGNRIKELLGSKVDPWWGTRRLWLAHYTTGTPTCQASWSTYWLWQFTDTGKVSGMSGDTDLNHFQGTHDALRAEWSGGDIIEPPTTEPSPAEFITVTIKLTLPKGSKVEVTS